MQPISFFQKRTEAFDTNIIPFQTESNSVSIFEQPASQAPKEPNIFTYMPESSIVDSFYEPLSEFEDIDYQYSEEKYSDLIEAFRANSSKMSSRDIKKYETLISEAQGDELKLMKSYLALKKLAKYDYDMQSEYLKPCKARMYDENDEILGQYCLDMQKLTTMIESDSEIKMAYDGLFESIYGGENAGNRFTILLNDDKEVVQNEAEKMLEEEAQKWNLSLDKIEYAEYGTNSTYTSDVDNEWNNWKKEISVSTNGIDKDDTYLPKELVMLHELYHIKQSTPGEKEDYSNQYLELGATIETIVMSDLIHKKINDIDADEEVAYGKSITTPSGKEYDIGTIAVLFENLMNNGGYSNYEQALMSEKGQSLVKKYFS